MLLTKFYNLLIQSIGLVKLCIFSELFKHITKGHTFDQKKKKEGEEIYYVGLSLSNSVWLKCFLSAEDQNQNRGHSMQALSYVLSPKKINNKLILWNRVSLCAQGDLELTILLPSPPKYWDYMCASSRLAYFLKFWISDLKTSTENVEEILRIQISSHCFFLEGFAL
jgi:hypothetical protein